MNATLRGFRSILPRLNRQKAGLRQAHGFTLLEVLVALTVLAIGSALTLSLISGSLGNIRKVQLRTRSIEHAREVMETALLDRSIQQPTSLHGRLRGRQPLVRAGGGLRNAGSAAIAAAGSAPEHAGKASFVHGRDVQARIQERRTFDCRR